MNKKYSLFLHRVYNGNGIFIDASLLLHDGRLALAWEGAISIYNIFSMKCELIIKVEGTTLSLAQFSNGKLVGVWDGIVRIYCIKQHSYSFFSSIIDNYPIFNVVEIYNNIIVSCGDCTFLKFWDLNYPHNIIKIVKYGNVNELCNIMHHLKKKNLLFVSSDIRRIIQFWDLDTYKCKLFTKRFSLKWRNSFFETNNQKLIIIERFDTLIVINLDNLTIDYLIKRADDYYESVQTILEIENNVILFGGFLGKIYLYDLNLKIIKEIKTRFREIINMQKIDEKTIITVHQRGKFKVWYLSQ